MAVINNRNTTSKVWYLFENLYWMLLCVWIYNVLLFIPLPGLSDEKSKLALWVTAAGLDVTGVAVTYRRRRNDTSTLANTLLYLELYALVTYYSSLPTAVLLISAVAAALAAVYFVAVLLQKESHYTGKTVSVFKRICHGILGSRTIITVCLLIFHCSVIFQFII